MSSEALRFISYGPLSLDRHDRTLRRAGVEVPLRRRAFEVLWLLIAAAGEAVTKETLLKQVWPGLTVEENNLQVQISALRKVLGDDVIGTIPGRGYRLRFTSETRGTPDAAGAVAKPSLAVLPFTNMSGDIDQEYFADGMADDVITELSRARIFFCYLA